MYLKNLKIESNEHIRNRFYRLVVEDFKISKESKPGQFVHIKGTEKKAPLLRRPFSIYKKEGDKIHILYEVIGLGTKLLSKMGSGMELSILGPLGSGFTTGEIVKTKYRKMLLVGGGIGIAPLQFLYEELKQDVFEDVGIKDVGIKDVEIEVALGFGSESLVIGVDEFLGVGIKPIVYTEDGTYGKKGFVTQYLKEASKTYDIIYACGPMGMLKEVLRIKGAAVHCEVSVHNFMGCGYGVCLGCVIDVCGEYKRVCKEGPVFKGKNLTI